jgi:hypothetical protein
MKRIHATALAAALLGAVPAWGQPAPAPAGGDNVLTLTKDGQPGQKCQVLRTYKHPSGGTAYEVKDQTTGEVLTVVENATTEQVKAVTPSEVKPPPADAKPAKADAKPAEKDAKSAKAGIDPILRPKDYNGDARVQKQLGTDGAKPAAKPDTQYTKPPVPAVKRWFGWMHKDTPAKPAAPVKGRKVIPQTPPPPAVPVVVEAAYHPDPVFRLIASLNDDLLPSMREVAAGELTRAGRGRPEAVEALLHSAQNDPAPGVRACCVHCLGEMHVRSSECLAALATLAADHDLAVRTEAANVLAELHQP